MNPAYVIWGLVYQKHISRAGTSRYIRQDMLTNGFTGKYWADIFAVPIDEIQVCVDEVRLEFIGLGPLPQHLKLFAPTATDHDRDYWRISPTFALVTLQWRHNGRDGVSNHRRLDGLLNRLFRRRSKKTLKLCVTGLCEGNSPVTSEFPSQRAINAENVSIWSSWV